MVSKVLWGAATEVWYGADESEDRQLLIDILWQVNLLDKLGYRHRAFRVERTVVHWREHLLSEGLDVRLPDAHHAPSENRSIKSADGRWRQRRPGSNARSPQEGKIKQKKKTLLTHTGLLMEGVRSGRSTANARGAD